MSEIFRAIPQEAPPSTKLPLWFRIKRRVRRWFGWLSWTRREQKLIDRIVEDVKLSGLTLTTTMVFRPVVTTTTTQRSSTVTRETGPTSSTCRRCGATFLDAFNLNGGTTLQCRTCGWSILG